MRTKEQILEMDKKIKEALGEFEDDEQINAISDVFDWLIDTHVPDVRIELYLEDL